jgi:hypothetical protein
MPSRLRYSHQCNVNLISRIILLKKLINKLKKCSKFTADTRIGQGSCILTILGEKTESTYKFEL